jgi:hypothetical protein
VVEINVSDHRFRERSLLTRCGLLLVMLGLAQPAAFAADSPPSDASIRELLEVSRTKQLVEDTRARSEASINANIQRLTGGRTITPDVQAAIDDMIPKVNALVAETLSWKNLEPVYMDVYRQSFTQEEVDGAIAFYRTEAGQAIVAKLPIVMQRTMEHTQELIADMTPRLQQIVQESLAPQAKPPVP